MDIEIYKRLERIRRGTRQPDVLWLCDELERALRTVRREPLVVTVPSGKRRGRPPLGERAMTKVERNRRWREKKRRERHGLEG